jgi:integrase
VKRKLTPAFVQKAQAEPGADRTIYWDTEVKGFGLAVTGNGHRSYVVQYRVGKVSRRMTLDGVLPLDAARKQARAILGEVARGRDPMAEKRAAAALTEDTFEAVAESYLAREEKKEDGKRLRTLGQRRRTLERLVYPALGKRPIGAIAKSEIVKLIDRIEDENGATMADRTMAIISRILNWHESRHDEFRSPIRRVEARAPADEHARKRVLNDDELRAVWRAAEAHPGPFGALVRFLLLTGARRSEAARMRWSEVSGSDWHLPPERNKVGKKMNEPLIRPLSPAAMSAIERLPRIGKAGFVFTTTGRTPLGGISKLKRNLDAACGVEGWVLHDLRRTASTLMARAGVNERHAEQCLGHVIRGMENVYNRHDYILERKAAYEALARQVEKILNPPPADNKVVPLRGA